MTFEHAHEHFTRILEQMPAVSDLDSVRCSYPSALGVCPTAVATDNFYARVLTQPCREGLCLSVRQDIDHRVTLQIDQHRSITPSAAHRPIIDPEHAGCWAAGGRQAMQYPQQ